MDPIVFFLKKINHRIRILMLYYNNQILDLIQQFCDKRSIETHFFLFLVIILIINAAQKNENKDNKMNP